MVVYLTRFWSWFWQVLVTLFAAPLHVLTSFFDFKFTNEVDPQAQLRPSISSMSSPGSTNPDIAADTNADSHCNPSLTQAPPNINNNNKNNNTPNIPDTPNSTAAPFHSTLPARVQEVDRRSSAKKPPGLGGCTTASTTAEQRQNRGCQGVHQLALASPGHINLDKDLDKGLSRDVQVHEMAAPKKRGGHKRAGVKGDGANGDTSATALAQHGNASTKLTPNQKQPSNKENIKEKIKENIGLAKTPGQAQGPGLGLGLGLAPTTKPAHAADADGHGHGYVNGPQSADPNTNAFVVSHLGLSKGPEASAPSAANKTIGAGSDRATSTSLAAKVKTKSAEGNGNGETVLRSSETQPLSAVDGVADAVGRISINDGRNGDDGFEGSEKTADQELNKDTAAIEAAAVPMVIGVPVANGYVVPKPLAPLVTPIDQVLPGLIEPDTEEGRVERALHLAHMKEALAMGQLALNTNETPVGCVLVYRGRTIAKGMNATNVTRNGTRHAEFMALSALLSHDGDSDATRALSGDDASWGDVDPGDGHIYPYGQKLHPAPNIDQAIISECVLYVTVEPCVMCASLLRQLGIKKVYFGAVNDKFGGTGGVFRIHMNSKPVARSADKRPHQNGYGPHDASRISRGRVVVTPRVEDDGDGGNVEPGFPVEGGYLRDEAVSLLRRFYVQENNRAPQPRKKEGRAARLYALERDTDPYYSLSDVPAARGTSTESAVSPTGQFEFVDVNNAPSP